MNSILCGLSNSELVKGMQFESVKDMWDKLVRNYGGDDKLKKENLKNFLWQFEGLKMNEEDVVYFLQVNEVVNSLKGFGKKLKKQ